LLGRCAVPGPVPLLKHAEKENNGVAATSGLENRVRKPNLAIC